MHDVSPEVFSIVACHFSLDIFRRTISEMVSFCMFHGTIAIVAMLSPASWLLSGLEVCVLIRGLSPEVAKYVRLFGPFW